MIPLVKLKPYIAQVRGIAYKPNEIADVPFENSAPLLKANNITDDGLDDSSLIYIASDRIKPEQFIRAGDLLLAASSGSKKAIGKNAHFPESFSGSFGAFCKVVRPKNGLHSDYLKHFFKTSYYRSSIENAVQGANINNLRNEHLDDLEIHLPPLNDQIRIAHLLGKVEGLIAQRKQHLQQLDDLLKSVFLEMFGDPVRNEKGWETTPFHKIGKFISGGTPSKSRDDFWSGTFPWVSPKDMKVAKISDAIDHISDLVFEETNLKRIAPNHLLIVVRGMILAHSFPVAINTVEIAINQDMKAIKPAKDVNVVYLQYCLTALKRQILKLISSAGHGTRKFDSVAMQKLFIPTPTKELQHQFAIIAEKVEALKSRYQQSLTDLESLYGALSQQAFKGELDLSRVPLLEPEQPADEVAMAIPEPETADKTMVIHFPESDTLPDALTDKAKRNDLLAFWLESYCQQIGNTPFSASDFLAAAQTRIAELHPDNEFELGLEDYEQIKHWVFEALNSGRLQQAQNITGQDENGQPILGNKIELKAGIEL